MNYGMPYMGSKNKIAEKIIDFLPTGKRIVDLFGGGGAISHCAALSKKWDSVLYNEVNPIIVETFRKAINGDYDMDKHPPEWISHEEFMKQRNVNGIMPICWSFGNNYRSYLYSKDIEPFKKAYHYACVFNDYSLLEEMGIHIEPVVADSIYERKLKIAELLKERKKTQPSTNLENLERLKRLQNLERHERLQSLENLVCLELSCVSYQDYEYKEGDVVYCDPPYENTEKYSKNGFNHKEFYDWVASRPYQVFFSSYDISDSRFYNVFEIEKRQNLKAGGIGKKINEIIYSNKPFDKKELLLFNDL